MITFTIPGDDVVVVTFDDQKTTLEDIRKALNRGGFTSEGEIIHPK